MPSEQPSFNLGVATSLNALVVQSFFTPYHPDHWRGFERGPDSTYTTYTDKEFLKSLVAGILEVKLFCVLGLEPSNSKRQPQASWFVSTELGNNRADSKKVSDTQRPEWNETLLLYVRDPEKEKLIIRLHNDVQASGACFHRSPKLGSAEVPILGLCGGKPHDLDVSIKDTCSDKVCKVYLQVLFKPIEDSVKFLAVHDIYLLVEPPCCPRGHATWLRGPPCKLNDLVSEKLGQDVKNANRKPGVKPGSKEDTGAKTWKEVEGLAGYNVKGQMQPVAFLDNRFTDTQVWLYRNYEARQIVVAFRSTKIQKEWLINSKYTKVEWSPTWPGVPNPPYVSIHKGFLEAYTSLRCQLLALLEHLTNPVVTVIQDKHCTCKKEEKWSVFITGSSLGGALAMLCAYDLGVRERASPTLHALAMYSFGAPRVGDSTFSNRYSKYVPDSWRVVRPDDFFPNLPPTNWGGWFHHAPNAVLLKPDGTYDVSMVPGNSCPSEGVDPGKLMSVAGTDIAMLAHFINLYPATLYKSAQQVQDAKVAAEKKKKEEEAKEKAEAYAPYKLLSPAPWF